MIHANKLRQMRESLSADASSEIAGRARFVQEIYASLGLMEQVGEGDNVALVECRDNFGRPTLAKSRMAPEEYSLRELGESIFGDSFDRYFNPSEAPDMLTMLEAGPGIDPTAFLNINTFSLAVGGLVQAKVLERFLNPGFIGDQLVEVRPTRLNGEKMIGTTAIGNKGQSRKPGEAHPRAGFGQRWVKTPELDEKALATEVYQETVFYDLTGEVLDRAGSVGEELGYLRELEILRLVAGVTNTYSYNDTTYNTYQTTAPWINDQSNAAQDYSDLDNSNSLFRKMSDPETGKRILIQPTQILRSPEREATWNRILNSTEVRETTNTNTITISPKPVNTNYTVLQSVVMDDVLTAAAADGGLALSASNAKEYWWHGDFKRAFAWMEAWPLRTRQASATEFVMLDRGIIAAYFSNYRGVGAIKEPRFVVRNKN